MSDVEAFEVRVVASLPLLDRAGRPVTNFGRVGVAIPADGPAALRPFDVDGRVPRAGAREALLDKETAAHLRVGAGDEVVLVDAGGARIGYRVTGLMEFGVTRSLSGSSVVGLTASDLTALTGVT